MKDKLWIFKEEKISFQRTLQILILIMLFSGVFGFVYEIIFYRIDLGYFVKRGSAFGPWIPIYTFGGGLILLFSYRFRGNPFLLFCVNCLITGLLEYVTGYVLYEGFGIRLWDYNTEIWNFGNIQGYICLRSVLLFGISSLFLMYVVLPFFKKNVMKIPEKTLSVFCWSWVIVFLFDVGLYAVIN